MREVISVHGKLPSTPPSLPIHALGPAHRIVCFFCVARAVLEHFADDFSVQSARLVARSPIPAGR